METVVNKKTGMDRTKAIIFLIGTATLWSFGGVLIKLISWNPIAIAGMRSAIAALLHIVILRKPRLTWSLPQIGAAVAYAVTVILFVLANKMTTAANAILLQYTAPVYVALFSAWLLKERTKFADWVTVFFVMGGMVLFFLDRLTTGGLLGNLLAIISGISFGSTIMLMRKQKSDSPLESVLLGNIATALIGLPFMFQSMPNTSSWLGLILLGIFQLGFSYVLYASAIKHVTALEGVLIPVLEPILNPVWVLFFVGEKPGPWSLAGGIVVLLAITARCAMAALKTETVPANMDIR